MRLQDGWHVSDVMSGAGNYITRSKLLIPFIENLKHRRAVVQAGGHIGVVPRLLSTYFEKVYAFEPEAENFRCLVRNADAPNIYPARGALGEKVGAVDLLIHSKNSGGHQIGEAGSIPTYRVDELGLAHCDAILLDTEGFEMPALRGARETIARHRPLIIAEENKQMLRRGQKYGDIEKYLAQFGYKLIARAGEDLVLSVPGK